MGRFSAAFEATSQHRFRDSADIQFAFAYFYFIMEGGAQEGIDLEEYWRQELDTNHDGCVVSLRDVYRDVLGRVSICVSVC